MRHGLKHTSTEPVFTVYEQRYRPSVVCDEDFDAQLNIAIQTAQIYQRGFVNKLR